MRATMLGAVLSLLSLMSGVTASHPHLECPGANTDSTDEDISCPTASPSEVDLISNISLRFYYGSSQYSAVPLDRATDLLVDPNFNSSRCVAVYSFGWGRSPETPDTALMIDAYLSTDRYNLIVNDWTAIASLPDYPPVVALVPQIAAEVAKAVDALVDSGARLCHIAGHSVSGQLIGHIGRRMRNTVPHMIALDPAGQFFYPPGKCEQPLSPTDAVCVEAIHTDGCNIGTLQQGGLVDIYFNRGHSPQPECARLGSVEDVQVSWPTCDHDHAVLYAAEALRNSSAFLGRLCETPEDFEEGLCDNNPTIYFGQCVPSKAGRYFLRTGSQSPFGEGERGATGR